MSQSFRDTLLSGLPDQFRERVEQRIASDKDENKSVPKMRRFHLNRIKDASGVSGTGIVAVGVVLPSGKAIMEWTSTRTGIAGLEIHENVENVEDIHGHEGATELVFDDEE